MHPFENNDLLTAAQLLFWGIAGWAIVGLALIFLVIPLIDEIAQSNSARKQAVLINRERALMNKDEFEAEFQKDSGVVVTWVKAHPMASAVIAALVLGVVLGFWMFHK